MSKKVKPDAMLVVLGVFARSKEPMNKYQIRKKTDLGQQTVYDAVRRLKLLKWIEVESAKEWRVKGLTVEKYALTDLGWFRAAKAYPELTRRVKIILGGKFHEFEERQSRNLSAEVRKWFRIAEEVILRGTAAPNWSMTIYVKADDKGQVTYGVRESHDAVKPTV